LENDFPVAGLEVGVELVVGLVVLPLLAGVEIPEHAVRQRKHDSMLSRAAHGRKSRPHPSFARAGGHNR